MIRAASTAQLLAMKLAAWRDAVDRADAYHGSVWPQKVCVNVFRGFARLKKQHQRGTPCNHELGSSCVSLELLGKRCERRFDVLGGKWHA